MDYLFCLLQTSHDVWLTAVLNNWLVRSGILPSGVAACKLKWTHRLLKCHIDGQEHLTAYFLSSQPTDDFKHPRGFLRTLHSFLCLNRRPLLEHEDIYWYTQCWVLLEMCLSVMLETVRCTRRLLSCKCDRGKRISYDVFLNIYRPSITCVISLKKA